MSRGVLAAGWLLALAGGLHAATWSEPTDAEVRGSVRYSAYPVHGLTAQEIWRDIGRKGPHQPERGLYSQAEAQIGYSWEVAFARGRGTCHVQSATVYVDVNILLPDWADKARGNLALRAAWNEYIAKVRRHEDHHKDIAFVAAHEIDRAIKAAPAHRDCRSLEHYIEAVAERILAKERAQQMHFDRTDRPIMLRGGG